jgi:site-specific DNA-methyltransferase (adenine-specific)
MKPTLTIGNAVIYQGNNLEVLPTLPDNSVDSIVCDPPYELGFMGKTWDSSGIAYSVELWQECLRVLKPGGHLLAFGGTRTWHRLAVAIEDAGFEIRDSIAWLYGSGFPKSHNVGNAIDKKLGMGNRGHAISSGSQIHPTTGEARPNGELLPKYEGRTPEGKKWDGWGTALKPAHEPIVVARKPLIGTVAQNVLEHGVGGLNIDASRIGTETSGWNGLTADRTESEWNNSGFKNVGNATESQGRWPANIILDEYTATLLPESNATGSGKASGFRKGGGDGNSVGLAGTKNAADGFSDSGSVSRFFYVAKASKRDRNEGLENIEGKEISAKGNGLARTCNTCGASTLDGCDCPDRTFSNPVRQNFHPTVKPTALMQYLIRLVTPANGVVLDPFAGSGSTGKAAILENKHFIGIEVTPEYLPIIEGRLQHAYETLDSKEDLF